MRNWLLSIVEKLHLKLLPDEIKNTKPQRVIPVFKCLAFRSGMNEYQLKRRLVVNMVDELYRYVEFTKKEDNGTIIVTARIDVVER